MLVLGTVAAKFHPVSCEKHGRQQHDLDGGKASHGNRNQGQKRVPARPGFGTDMACRKSLQALWDFSLRPARMWVLTRGWASSVS